MEPLACKISHDQAIHFIGNILKICAQIFNLHSTAYLITKYEERNNLKR